MKLEISKVLITRLAEFIGFYLRKLLLSNGWTVIGIDQIVYYE